MQLCRKMTFKYSKSFFFPSQNAINMKKKPHAREYRMAKKLTTAFKLTFAKKYRIFDNKHSVSIHIKEQYSVGVN